MSRSTRRTFIKSLTAAGAGLALARSLHAAPVDKLNVASIGTGGKGWSDLTETAKSPHVNVVALCDIDESAAHLGRAAETFPKARRYTDWRRLLDESRDVDAVLVSTPDHMHAPITLAALALGKHVHCQKPLTHTVSEAREVQRAAKKAGVVTQMGNQIQSHVSYRTAVQVVHDGVIGKVREVFSWQSGTTGWVWHPFVPTKPRSTTRSTGGPGRISATGNSVILAATFSTRCSWPWS
jgi:predicted dehydrogenase